MNETAVAVANENDVKICNECGGRIDRQAAYGGHLGICSASLITARHPVQACKGCGLAIANVRVLCGGEFYHPGCMPRVDPVDSVDAVGKAGGAEPAEVEMVPVGNEAIL